MKRLFYLLSIVLLTMFSSCDVLYDDSELVDRINKLEEEQKQLEEEQKEMQEQIDAQQTHLDALTKNLTITSIVETDEGYVVTFSDNSTMIVGQGNSYIENIEVGEEAIIFTLADGTEVVLPLNSGGNSGGEVVGENNKIYYTTSDGKKLFPNNTEPAAFGALLVSNIYKDGHGVLTFDDTVTTIGEWVFGDCSSLTSVTIPDSVTTIGDYAFSGCGCLTSVTIGDGVTTIGDRAFYWCRSLTSVYISDMSVWCKIDFGYDCANPLCYAENLYLNNKLVTDLVIPSDITEIKDYAFRCCSSLTSVTIGDSVTTIGVGAFCECSSLTSVTIGDSVTTIGIYAFSRCSSLTSITIPDSVTTIGDRVFEGCSSLTSVTIGDSVTTIGEGAFNGCSSLTSVYCKPTTPPAVTLDYYDWCAFDDNASGRKIYVPTESVDAYKSADGWSTYASYIVGYDF